MKMQINGKDLSLLVIVITTLSMLITPLNANERQTKVSACMKIFKSRMAKDSLYFQTFVDMLSRGSDKEEATNKLLSLCLLTCYNQIEFYKADDINRTYGKDFKKIPSMEEDYKTLLGMEKWYDIFSSNDKQRMEMEMEMLSDAAREIRSEDLNFEEDNGSRETEQPEAQDIYYNREKKMDLDIFGINLTQLDPMIKNILGLSLIFLVFFTVLYGLNWIKNLRKKNEKVKKNKKKN